jgi:hypothetical protein
MPRTVVLKNVLVVLPWDEVFFNGPTPVTTELQQEEDTHKMGRGHPPTDHPYAMNRECSLPRPVLGDAAWSRCRQ